MVTLIEDIFLRPVEKNNTRGDVPLPKNESPQNDQKQTQEEQRPSGSQERLDAQSS